MVGREETYLEWMGENLLQTDPGHRHFSHLFGVFPASQVEIDSFMEQAALLTINERMR